MSSNRLSKKRQSRAKSNRRVAHGFKHSYSESDYRDHLVAECLPHFRTIRPRLLTWFRQHRRDFPWRRTFNWFHLLMAEMMLRRTRADQVLPVYLEFTRRYKTARSAGQADSGELDELFYTLGLHWRSKQLRSTIQYIQDNYNKRQPRTNLDFQRIPGVGDYSSAMIRSRLYGDRAAAIDSNVARFFARVSGLEPHPENRRNPYIIQLADAFVRGKYVRDLNIAIVDFAALVCLPRRPLCQSCPLRSYCATGKKNTSK